MQYVPEAVQPGYKSIRTTLKTSVPQQDELASVGLLRRKVTLHMVMLNPTSSDLGN